MQKWEYKMFKMPGIRRDPTELNTKEEDEAILQWLQILGDEGWEAVHLRFKPFSYSNDPKMAVQYGLTVKGYFKRAIATPGEKFLCPCCGNHVEGADWIIDCGVCRNCISEGRASVDAEGYKKARGN